MVLKCHCWLKKGLICCDFYYMLYNCSYCAKWCFILQHKLCVQIHSSDVQLVTVLTRACAAMDRLTAVTTQTRSTVVCLLTIYQNLFVIILGLFRTDFCIMCGKWLWNYGNWLSVCSFSLHPLLILVVNLFCLIEMFSTLLKELAWGFMMQQVLLLNNYYNQWSFCFEENFKILMLKKGIELWKLLDFIHWICYSFLFLPLFWLIFT